MGMETIKSAPTFTAEICMAGDYADAVRTCKNYCADVGLCVTITRTEYVYTGGAESGVIVRLMNYPRFPSTSGNIRDHALALAGRLRQDLCQHSFSVIMPDQTIWNTTRRE